jgi:hypothetical protein
MSIHRDHDPHGKRDGQGKKEVVGTVTTILKSHVEQIHPKKMFLILKRREESGTG